VTENVGAILMLALNEFYNDEISGQPELSIARLEAQRSLLPRDRFTILHILHMTAVMSAGCATGRHAWGFERSAEYWHAFMRSPLRRTGVLRAITHMARARLLLNEHVRCKRHPSELRQVLPDVKAMFTLVEGQGQRLLARVAYLKGDHAGALALLSRSVEDLTTRNLEPEALRSRYALGRLTGGEEGERMAQVALDTLEQKFGLPDARRNLRAYFPEFAGSVEHG
jgi:hypothetical protein